jgi:hypothetical protein
MNLRVSANRNLASLGSGICGEVPDRPIIFARDAPWPSLSPFELSGAIPPWRSVIEETELAHNCDEPSLAPCSPTEFRTMSYPGLEKTDPG